MFLVLATRLQAHVPPGFRSRSCICVGQVLWPVALVLGGIHGYAHGANIWARAKFGACILAPA